MYLIYVGSTPTLMFFLGATSLGPSASISQNGAPFGSSANSPVEVGSGWYSLALSSLETNVPGPLAIHFSAGTPADFTCQVGAVVGADCVMQAGQNLPALVGSFPPVQTSVIAANGIDAAAIATDVIARLFSSTVLLESYAADGVTATPAQLLYMLWSALSEFAISGGTLSSKKLDGVTQAMAFDLAPPGSPTSRARSA